MIHIRDEGGVVRQGLNFYPLTSNQVGFVFRFKDLFFTLRYNKKLGKVRCHKHNII